MTQRVLVTAGASGIGRETARAFAVAGGRLIEEEKKGRGRCWPDPCNGSSTRDIAALAVFLASDAGESISG